MAKKYFTTFFILINLSLYSQVNYIQYSVKDGLPQMQCMKIMQDSKGYIWIGTKGGISKYNGIAFENFFIDDGLPDSQIIDIKEDKNGTIWILTQNGLSSFKDHQITHFPVQKNLLFKDDKIVIDNTGNGTIWIIEGYYKKRLIKFREGTYQVKFTSEKGQLRGLSFDDQNKKLIFTELSSKGSKLYSYQHNTLQLEYQLKGNQFLLNYENKLAIKSKNKSTTIYKLTNNDTLKLFKFDQNIQIIKRLNDSTIVFSSSKFDTKMPVHILRNNRLLKTSNYFDQINDLLQDSEGNIWVATETGLFKIVPFYNYSENDSMPDYVWSIQEDKHNKIWFASYSSDHLYYLKNDSICKYPKTFSNGYFYVGGIQSKKGENYFTNRSGVTVYDGQTFSNLDLPEPEAVLSIFEDSLTSKLYFGTYKGLFIKDKYGAYQHNKGFVKGKDEVILKMVMNKKKAICFITKKMFGIINRSGDIIYKNELINDALSLHCDDRGNLWIGTMNDFYFYDYNKIIKIKHPELKRMIGSVIRADDNHIVYGGLRGIGMLDLKKFYKIFENINDTTTVIDAEKFVTYYSNSHGFMGEEVGQDGMFKDSKNRIWVPTNTNVVMFRPEDLKSNLKAPNTYITKLESSQDNLNWTIFDSKAQLKYTNNNIKINYIGISHTAPKEVRYKYRLKGFSDQWVNATTSRNVTYTNLDPGKYSFELKAKNNNGIWTKEAKIKSFKIKSAIWQSIWFQIGCFVLLISIIYQFVTFFYHQRKRKSELSDRLRTLQMRAIQSQLYPHLLFNAASAAGSVIYKEDKDKAYDFVVKLSQLMRRALVDNQKTYKSIQEELDFVKNYLEIQKIRFSERFDYIISIDDTVNMELQVPQMILQTYVENAIKHGLEPLKRGGVLKIDIKDDLGNIKMIVADNGIGLMEAKKNMQKGTHSGLKIMNEIYKVHNENSATKISIQLIDLYEEKAIGTKVIIDLKKK